MKNLTRMVSILIFLSIGAYAQTTSDPLTITLSIESPTVKTGSSIWVKIQMTNTSNHDVSCSSHTSNGVDRNYKFDVRDEKGNRVPRKKVKHPELEGGGSFKLCTLGSGQTTTADESLVSQLFDLTQPGQYTIQVSRHVEGAAKDVDIKSNSVTLTITP